MSYDRFDDQITQKYGIVIKNWPLKNFCNPSSVGSRIELETLYNGWYSGVTRFEKLTEEEMVTWENERFATRLTMMSAAPPEPTPEPARSSPPDALLSVSLALPTPPNPSPPQPPTTGQHSPPCTWLSTTSAPPTPSTLGLPQPSTTGQRTSSVVSHTLNPTSPESSPLQTPNPDLIANMIHSDPSLQNIDPILLAAVAPQEHRSSTVVLAPTATPTTPPANPPPPPSRSKRNRDAFQVFTPQLYGIPTKRMRKERRGKRSKKGPTAQGLENIAPGDPTP